MPINFQPYIPQAPDLLSPVMNMQKLQQGQQELQQGQERIQLLRENQDMERQQLEEQSIKREVETALKLYEIKPEVGKAAWNNSKRLKGLYPDVDLGNVTDEFYEDNMKLYKDYVEIKEKDPKMAKDFLQGGMFKIKAKYSKNREMIESMEKTLLPEKKSEIGTVSPDKFTPESLARYQQTGNYGDLVSTVKPGKQIERTIDLGDKQRVIYTDGTEEDLPKGVSPNTAIKINMGDQRGDARFAMNLRKEFNALQPVKDYRDITTKYNVMTEAFKESKKTNNYVAVDQALITLYNKMTDPQSVVRESEYVRTPQDMAIMDRMESAMIRVGKGGRLEPDTRQAIMTMAGKFKKAYESKYNEIANEYRGYAGSSGVEPDNVVKQVKGEKQQPRNIFKAVTYLKSSKDRNDAKNRMKALMSASGEEGNWTDEELREIERQAGY